MCATVEFICYLQYMLHRSARKSITYHTSSLYMPEFTIRERSPYKAMVMELIIGNYDNLQRVSKSSYKCTLNAYGKLV